MEPPESKIRPSDKLSTNIAWALRFVWQSGHGLTVANAVVTLIQSVMPVLSLYLIKLVVDAVSARVTGAERTAAFSGITFLILASAGVVFLDRALSTISDWVRSAQTYLATDRIYEILHSKSIEVDLEYYENSDYYDALHRAQEEASYRPTRILDGIFTLAQSGVSVIAIGALLLTFHWSVPIFLIVAAVPGLLIRFRFARKLYIWSRQKTPAERQALYFNSLLTGDGHAKELRLFNLGDVFVRRFGRLRNQIRKERLDLLRKRSIADLLAQFAAMFAAFGLYGFLAYRAIQGLMTVGDLVMFYQGIQRGQSYLSQLLGSVAVLYENNLFISNIHEFLALKPRITDSVHAVKPAERIRQGIVFHGVRFRYPNSDRTVLDTINLHIRPGEHIALVGENGCGKTTLVKLLSRLYDPTGGAITLDGVDLRELSLGAFRRKVSVVFQDFAKYQLSAKENIWFGDVGTPPGVEQIEIAARKAGAHNSIAKLRDGYDTVLGRWFADGEELSVGEWQKIALARAFFREAEIVILDEPTSALDAKSEYEVFKKFHELSLGRTVILISHRLSTVKMADRICFLENGTIVESGSHDELIDQGGKYAYMFEKQAQYYR